MTKAFITYHPADQEAAAKFLEQFADVVQATLGGVTEKDDFIANTPEPVFLQREIRERYLKNSIITIMLAGKCTWSQRFVDWEIAASLRNDPVRGRNALLGIRLPYMATAPSTTVPERFQDNLKLGYAAFRSYPATSEDLRALILRALEHRDSVTPDNSRPLMTKNEKCK